MRELTETVAAHTRRAQAFSSGVPQALSGALPGAMPGVLGHLKTDTMLICVCFKFCLGIVENHFYFVLIFVLERDIEEEKDRDSTSDKDRENEVE